jgi:nucleoside-diphosphate-sugar epimerase
MEKHLVIGASGQLGIELVLGLQSRYGVDAVVAADIRMGGDIESNRSEFIKLDATDKVAVNKTLAEGGFTCVYHLVAMLSAKGEENPIAAWDLNMKSILNVLECAKEGLVEKVFWPSSIAVFGPEAPKNLTPQDTFCDPTTIYGVSKVAGELWCKYYHEHYGVDVRSLRYPGLIGHRSQPGGGTTDYAIRATLDLMEAPDGDIKLRTSYNLSGCSFSPDDLNNEIAELIPGFTTKYAPDKRQHIAASWPNSIDDNLARVHWGWKAEYDTEKLVFAMIKALKNSLSLAQ